MRFIRMLFCHEVKNHMTPNRFPATLTASIAFAIGLTQCVSAQSPLYAVVPLAPPTNGAWCDVNFSGQLAGEAPVGNGFSFYAGDRTASHVLALPSGWTAANVSVPVAINDLGQVLGSAVNPSGAGQAFLATASGNMIIPIPPTWSWAAGTAVNNVGQVAGFGYNGVLGTGPMAWTGNSTATSGIPIPTGSLQSEAYSINASGQSAGAYYIPTPNSPYAANTNQAFTYSTAGLVTVNLPQPNQALAVGISDAGQVAGWIQVLPDITARAFSIFNGVSTVIPLPAGTVGIKSFGSLVSNSCGSQASLRSGHIISNGGLVIGNASTLAGSDINSPANTVAWLWDTVNGTRLLSSLVPAPWNIINAISISNSGMILAYGMCSGTTCPSSGNYSGYILLAPQSGACDLDGDMNINVPDVQLVINEALGALPNLNDINQDGTVNIVDVQLVMNAALGKGCS